MKEVILLRKVKSVNFHHGTETAKNLVASVSPGNSEAGVIGMIMASMGLIFITADYHGLGDSEEAFIEAIEWFDEMK